MGPAKSKVCVNIKIIILFDSLKVIDVNGLDWPLLNGGCDYRFIDIGRLNLGT